MKLTETQLQQLAAQLLIFFTAVILCGCSSQKFSNRFNSFNCYISNSNATIPLYNPTENSIAKDSLVSLNIERCCYVLELSNVKQGMFQIKNIGVMPGCREQDTAAQRYKGLWIKSSDAIHINTVYYNFDGGQQLKVYSAPDAGAAFNLLTENKDYTLLDFKNGWAKVKYTDANTTKTAWLRPQDQCALPWTICPNID